MFVVYICLVMTYAANFAIADSDPNDQMLRTFLGGYAKPGQGKQKDKGSQPCVDIVDCDWYGPDICLANATFAEKNCRQFCGLCGIKCKDRESNCFDYDEKYCKEHQTWASEKCARRCGKCYKLVPSYLPCYDRSRRCDDVRKCFDATLARRWCKKSCGLCGNSTTTYSCSDGIPNCSDYSRSVCTDHPDWSHSNCQKWCGLCDVPSVLTTAVQPKALTETCQDDIDNCDDYDSSICQEYKSWAKKNCNKFCGYCKVSGKATTTGSICEDKITNCHDYGLTACQGLYKPWAQLNCKKFCGFCKGAAAGTTPITTPITTPLTSTSPITSSCEDKIDNCSAYGSYACQGDYKPWATVNCNKYCGFCTDTAVGTTPTTTPLTITSPIISSCKDKIDNCAAYGSYACQGDYKPWATVNCNKYCGFCTVQPTSQATSSVAACEDRIDNCSDYGRSACEGAYISWARQNCNKYCGFCTVVTTSPKPLPENCKDKYSSCGKYTGMTCLVDEKWVKENCARTCRKCD